MFSQRSHRGFTLVEILIVVVIIAILASLVVPRMIAQVDKAKAVEALQMFGAIKRAVERDHDLNGSYPIPPDDGVIQSGRGIDPHNSWELLGLKDPGTETWGYAYVSNGEYWSGIVFFESGEMDYFEYNGERDWYCDGTLFVHSGGDNTPCVLK